jgi:lipopolysaccharide biosynthesis regulator YciM
MVIDLKNLRIDPAIDSFVSMVNKNKIAYILALPKIIQTLSDIDNESIDLKLRDLLNNDPESPTYLAIVGVTYPEIRNDVIEEVIQNFIENQDIVREIDKLDNEYSIVSTISNHLSQSMRFILNKKMNTEYKYNCKKCGYQTISFSWQCPTCKSWESSLSINFLKAI